MTTILIDHVENYMNIASSINDIDASEDIQKRYQTIDPLYVLKHFLRKNILHDDNYKAPIDVSGNVNPPLTKAQK